MFIILQVHVLQEDWINKTVQLVASCSVMDVNDISVDKTLPLYCTIVSQSGRVRIHSKGHYHCEEKSVMP